MVVAPTYVDSELGIHSFLGENTDLGLGDIVFGILQKSQDDVLNVLADIAGLCQGGGVADGERNFQDPGKRTRQERFAATGRPDQKNIGFFKLDRVE